jgi:hypothetical protein
LRKFITAFVVLGTFALSVPALAIEFRACWVDELFDPVRLEHQTVTRCRIVGGETVDYASDNDVPDVLYPNMGTDVTGQCWYLTSATTQYVIVTRYADGSAEMGYDTDPGNPGSIIAVGPVVPRCTSEPAPETDPSADVWDYVMSYVHPPPAPDINPSAGDGITGLPTFVGVAVPSDHDATLTSGLSTLDIEIDVDAVIVSWGDGSVDTYPPLDTILAGYPDGAATHVYEVKTNDGTSITVSYDWTARWRVDGGTWTALAVPNTSTSISYPVAEVVSRLTG